MNSSPTGLDDSIGACLGVKGCFKGISLLLLLLLLLISVEQLFQDFQNVGRCLIVFQMKLEQRSR